jgi:hypothetical protein
MPYLCREEGDTSRQADGMKAPAVLLYAPGNAGFGMIAGLLDASDVVVKWIRVKTRAIPESMAQDDLLVVTLDETWHFVQGMPQSLGLARL